MICFLINCSFGIGRIQTGKIFILQPSGLALRVLIPYDLLFHLQVGIGEGVSPSAATDLIARYVPLPKKCIQHFPIVLHKLLFNIFCAFYFLLFCFYVMEFIKLYVYAPFSNDFAY